MADELTVEQALKELQEILPPRTFARITVHLHGEMNRPTTYLKTVDSAEIYIDGGYWFCGPTLTDAMAQVRAWHEQQKAS